MSNSQRLDIFEPNDLTALICALEPEFQNLFIQNLTELNYKIHTGISIDDLVLKLRTHTYDLLIIPEILDCPDLESNRVLQEAISAPAANRHRQFIVLIGSNFITADETQAFEHSVDMVLAQAQIAHFRPVLRRTLARTQDFYAPFRESLHKVGAE